MITQAAYRKGDQALIAEVKFFSAFKAPHGLLTARAGPTVKCVRRGTKNKDVNATSGHQSNDRPRRMSHNSIDRL